ncbi:hypothetical protein NP233_g5295 [Leucocoprinus birnbaumii]|uniref:Uncharacterized protein n=1 Tax=Leucocoprinus birnbaumii TaxID=56174 RepID=A0AAD5YR32_9AGAR|nr:hypothetical protein NP233_g5295 [Leucocoprinus birnbaumii]
MASAVAPPMHPNVAPVQPSNIAPTHHVNEGNTNVPVVVPQGLNTHSIPYNHASRNNHNHNCCCTNCSNTHSNSSSPSTFRSIPSLTIVPILKGRSNFNDWETVVKTAIGSLRLYGHVYDGKNWPQVPGIHPSYPPDIIHGTEEEQKRSAQWWEDDFAAQHVLLTHVSTTVNNMIQASHLPTAREILNRLTDLYAGRQWHSGKATWDSLVSLCHNNDLQKYCQQWLSGFTTIRQTQYPLATSVAITGFFNKLPDIGHLGGLKGDWCRRMRTIDDLDPAPFHTAVQDALDLLDTFGNRRLLLLQNNTAPPQRGPPFSRTPQNPNTNTTASTPINLPNTQPRAVKFVVGRRI